MRSSRIAGLATLGALGAACGGNVDLGSRQADTGPDAAGGSAGASGNGSSAQGGTSGDAGTAGYGGSGATTPLTPTSKVDLLFMIDNSSSMADKQVILQRSAPKIIDRLVNPYCVPSGGGPAQPPATGGACPTGTVRQALPITDLHVGVISSSLGGHGGDLCTPAENGYNPDAEDMAHMMGTVRTGLRVDDAGFLMWKSGDDAAALSIALSDHIGATSEHGCGYESSLEAWFRFLVDPAPTQRVFNDGSNTVPELDSTGKPLVDKVVLAQRKAFLRPDSAVVIVMMSDEDDCSILDHGPSWLVGRSGGLPRATTACQVNPNDPCCRSCADAEPDGPPVGCTDISADAECARGAYEAGQEDSANLRCWDQKRRFGIDFLQPTARYVVGLLDPVICPDSEYGDMDCQCRAAHVSAATCQEKAGAPRANPLYSDLTGGNAPPRSPEKIFLAGIIGVPWQDLATDATRNGAGLEYLTAAELKAKRRWDLILGDLSTNRQPTDPFMVSTPESRVSLAASPLTGITPTAFGSSNAINGSEYDIPMRDDLQYACVFDLATPKDCSASTNCDCGAGVQKPLCDSTDPVLQARAKAYPGLRYLQVMRDFGDRAIVSSLCPKVATDSTSPFFGYAPSAAAIVDRLASVLAK